MDKPKTRSVRLEEIVVDRTVNPRERINEEHVEDLMEAIGRGKDLPMPVCYDVGGKLKLAEGFHRLTAYQRLRKLRIDVQVITGTEEEWAVAALCSNQDHGLKRTNAEKRLAVEGMLKRVPNWSSNRIANSVGVSHVFVEKIRDQLVTVTSCDKRSGADGKERSLPKPASDKPVTSNDKSEQSKQPESKIGQTNRTNVSATSTGEPVADGDKSGVESDAEAVQEGDPEPVNLPQEDSDGSETDVQETVEGIVEQAEAVCYQLDQIKRKIDGWKHLKGGRSFHYPTLIGYVESLRSNIWQARPDHECPYCRGTGTSRGETCTGCKGDGILCKAMYRAGKASTDRYGVKG